MMDSVDKSIDVDVEAIWPYRDYKALIDTWGDLACDQDQSVEPCKFIRDIRGIQIPSYKHRKIKKIRGIGKRRSIIYRKGRYKEFMFTNCYPLSMPTKNTVV